jgi:hypothetical protein
MDAQVINGRHDQRPVEEVVVLLARRFSDKQTAMTRSSVQKPALVFVLGAVLRANWVI